MSVQTEERLRIVLGKELEAPVNDLGLKDNLDKLELNSLTFVKLLVAVENEFGVEFSDEDLMGNRFQTLEDIIFFLDQNGG